MEHDHQPVRIAVVDRPLVPSDALDEVERADAGAVALFVGTVRDHSADRPGVTHL
ncbi:MAG: molybdenum cofactor biosynthesis protein MoaE, partial [Acidimicrobiia bacterium]